MLYHLPQSEAGKRQALPFTSARQTHGNRSEQQASIVHDPYHVSRLLLCRDRARSKSVTAVLLSTLFPPPKDRIFRQKYPAVDRLIYNPAIVPHTMPGAGLRLSFWIYTERNQ